MVVSVNKLLGCLGHCKNIIGLLMRGQPSIWFITFSFFAELSYSHLIRGGRHSERAMFYGKLVNMNVYLRVNSNCTVHQS